MCCEDGQTGRRGCVEEIEVEVVDRPRREVEWPSPIADAEESEQARQEGLYDQAVVAELLDVGGAEARRLSSASSV